MRLTPYIACLAVAAAAAGCTKDPTEGKTVAKVEAPAAAAPAAEPKKAEPVVAANLESLEVGPENSSIGFVGAKVTATHDGVFKEFKGTIALADGKLEGGKVEFEVKPGSVITDGGNPKLEGHLVSPDFFHVEKFPTATFVSREIKAGSDAEGMTHTVTGDLTLRGKTQTVTFPAKATVDAQKVTATTEFGINRKDFGIQYPGMPDDLIKDNVLLKVALEAERKAEAKPAAAAEKAEAEPAAVK